MCCALRGARRGRLARRDTMSGLAERVRPGAWIGTAPVMASFALLPATGDELMDEIRIPLDGLEIAALTSGPAEAPPLLALHGWLDNGASFAWLAEHLPGRRVIALDLPGHGHSDHLPSGPFVHFSFTGSVPVVLAIADALGLERFDLLGHSMGAGIASLVAAAAPARVRRLAVIEGLGPMPDNPETTLSRFRNAVAQRSGRRQLRVFADVEGAIEARHRASGLPPELARPIIERALRWVQGGWSWRSDPRLTDPTLLYMTEGQARRLLAGISCPVWLLLADPPPPYLPPALVAARAAEIADIRIEHMAGQHHIHLEHPAEVAARIEAFLAAGDAAG